MPATHDPSENNATYRTPLWVKTFGIVVLILILLVVVLVTGIGGEHGPGRHVLPSTGAGSDSSSLDLETQPDGSHIPPVAHGNEQP